MKKTIIILLVLLGIIILPFAVIKIDEKAQAEAERVRQNQNKEIYQEAIKYVKNEKYDKALEWFGKLPKDYEDAKYIVMYAEFCQAVDDNEGIEELIHFVRSFPNEEKYNGEFAEKMREAKKETEAEYEAYERQKEKEKKEEIRKDTPYKGLEEKYINITILGSAREKRTGHYWRNTPGKRTQDVQHVYIWYTSSGGKKFMATCRNGRVSSVVQFVSVPKPNTTSNGSKIDKNKDMYDVYDYDDPEDFYYDHADEFDDIQDAEDYWEEAQ